MSIDAGSDRDRREAMALTLQERSELEEIARRLRSLRAFLIDQPLPDDDTSLERWFALLSAMKRIVGNASNDMSFVSTLMAKEYLNARLRMVPFDAADKAQGAPGLDIDARTADGDRVIAEIKTTTPYLGNDLGAAQKAAFARDFEKLRRAEAEHKFFFVTDPATFEIVARHYADELAGVSIVLLGAGDPS